MDVKRENYQNSSMLRLLCQAIG